MKATHQKLNEKYEADKEKYESEKIKKRPADKKLNEPDMKQPKISFAATGIDPKLQNEFDETINKIMTKVFVEQPRLHRVC